MAPAYTAPLPQQRFSNFFGSSCCVTMSMWMCDELLSRFLKIGVCGTELQKPYALQSIRALRFRLILRGTHAAACESAVLVARAAGAGQHSTSASTRLLPAADAGKEGSSSLDVDWIPRNQCSGHQVGKLRRRRRKQSLTLPLETSPRMNPTKKTRMLTPLTLKAHPPNPRRRSVMKMSLE